MITHVRRCNQSLAIDEESVVYPAWVKDMVKDLVTLSCHEYTKVRSRAQTTLEEFVKHAPVLALMLTSDIIQILASSKVDHEITGACFLLGSSPFMTQLVRHARLWQPFVAAVSVPSRRELKPVIEGYIEEVYCRFVAGFTSGISSVKHDSHLANWPDPNLNSKDSMHWKFVLMRMAAMTIISCTGNSIETFPLYVLDACTAQVYMRLCCTCLDSSHSECTTSPHGHLLPTCDTLSSLEQKL